jgi:hypothetical protein
MGRRPKPNPLKLLSLGQVSAPGRFGGAFGLASEPLIRINELLPCDCYAAACDAADPAAVTPQWPRQP